MPRAAPRTREEERRRVLAVWLLRSGCGVALAPCLRSLSLPQVGDSTAFAHLGISVNGEPVLNLRQMYALVQRLHGGCGMVKVAVLGRGRAGHPRLEAGTPSRTAHGGPLGSRAEL